MLKQKVIVQDADLPVQRALQAAFADGLGMKDCWK